MQLWTIQTKELYDTLMRQGYVYCDRVGYFNKEYPSAYQWMCEQMRQRIGEPPLPESIHYGRTTNTTAISRPNASGRRVYAYGAAQPIHPSNILDVAEGAGGECGTDVRHKGNNVKITRLL